jgi:hypothetical protein
MARSRVILGTEYFPRPDVGRPVSLGSVYIGIPDLDPEVLGNRKTVYLIQEDGTEVPIAAASQPLDLGAGGVIMYSGSPVQIQTDDEYSIKVLDQLGTQIYYFNSISNFIDVTPDLLQTALFYPNDISSASNAYVITPPLSPLPVALVDGQLALFRPSNNGSGSVTISVILDGGASTPKQWLLPDKTNQLPSTYVRTTRDYLVRFDAALDVWIDVDLGLFSKNPSIQTWNQYIDYTITPSYVTGSDLSQYYSTATSGPNYGGAINPVTDTTGVWLQVNNAVDPTIMDFRLTLLSGSPVNNTNVTNATTVYITPYIGNRISLYSGGRWSILQSVEKSLALGAVTDEMMYDLFAYNNAGVLALEKLVWSTSNARATALAYQDGVLVKSGDATRRYIGSFFTNSVTQTGDNALCDLTSNTGRFIWNYYNRVPRQLYNGFTVGSHNYTTATWRKWNDAASEVITYCVGVAEDSVQFSMTCVAANSNAAVGRAIGIGNNSATVPESVTGSGAGAANSTGALFITANFLPQLGRNDVYGLQYSDATGTTAWSAGAATGIGGGLTGTVPM